MPLKRESRRPHGVVPIHDASDALAGGRKEDGIVKAYLIHELDPSFGSRVVKATVRTDAKGARRSVGKRELDVALSGKHTVSQAAPRGSIGKMAGDAFAVLENMAVTINYFQLLFHRILLANDGLRHGVCSTALRISSEGSREIREGQVLDLELPSLGNLGRAIRGAGLAC